jgi:hypothetical protein
MANDCTNTVTIEGSEDPLTSLKGIAIHNIADSDDGMAFRNDEEAIQAFWQSWNEPE